jgi:hypothetical protein
VVTYLVEHGGDEVRGRVRGTPAGRQRTGRVPATAPGVGTPGVDSVTARLLAEEAVRRLGGLHSWTPRAAHSRRWENLLTTVGSPVGPRCSPRLSTSPPPTATESCPVISSTEVHADCHWGNWLACDQSVTALLDFEWARFGEPADDWFFLARFSGPHMEVVLDVIARATTTSPDILRAECEVLEAAYLASDLRAALGHPGARPAMAADRLRALEELIGERYWWRHTP